MEPLIWRDGSLIDYSQATAHVMSHMAARGSQVFDVMAVVETEAGPSAFGFREHMSRFVRSMGLMAMEDLPSVGKIEAAVATTIAANCTGPEAPLPDGPWLVKVLAAWDGEAVGLLPASLSPTTYVVVTPYAGAQRLGHVGEPAKVKTATMPKIPAEVLPPALKVASSYTPALRHMLQAKSEGFDHVVFKNLDGDLAESVASSVLVVSSGKIVAPPLDTVLDGITRRAVLEAATFLDIPTEIRPVRWDEVLKADELIFTSTTTTVLPVGVLDDTDFEAPGPVAAKLGAVMGEVLHGQHELSGRWMTPMQPLAASSQ